MSVFDQMHDVLFRDRNLAVEATYRVGGVGDGVPVRLVEMRPDQQASFGESQLHTESTVFELRTKEIASPAAGDTITLAGGETFIVQGTPRRDDDLRLTWYLDTRPGGAP